MPRKKVRCARLKYPVWVNGQSCGKVCATKIQETISHPDYHEEIKSLKLQVRELQTKIHRIEMNSQIPTSTPPVAAPPPTQALHLA